MLSEVKCVRPCFAIALLLYNHDVLPIQDDMFYRFTVSRCFPPWPQTPACKPFLHLFVQNRNVCSGKDLGQTVLRFTNGTCTKPANIITRQHEYCCGFNILDLSCHADHLMIMIHMSHMRMPTDYI